MAPVRHEPSPPQQLLLVTLIVRIAVMSLLAIMLVRYHRFRDLLIHERRGWPMKFFFAFSLGLLLTAGVVARLLLGYKALDITLEGAFLAGLVTGPWGGALVGAMLGTPALIAREWAALPFAIGCGFAAGGIREACPKEAIWRFSPFVLRRRAPLRLADLPALRDRLADRPAGGADRPAAPAARRSATAGRRGSTRSTRQDPFQTVMVYLGDDSLHRGPDQDLERRPHRAPGPRSRRSCS